VLFATLDCACSREGGASASKADKTSSAAPKGATSANLTDLASDSKAPLGASASAAGSKPSAEPGLCARLCEHTERLKCGATPKQCSADCEQVLSAPKCALETRAAFECIAAQEAAAFECNDSMATIKNGNCNAQQAAVARCFGATGP
jgi:hypothetical protein